MQIEAKDYNYYVVFMDNKDNFIEAYGYEEKPNVLDLKYAFGDMLEADSMFSKSVPDAQKVFDYVTVDIMKHKKFVKYMEDQEARAKKLEAKKEKE